MIQIINALLIQTNLEMLYPTGAMLSISRFRVLNTRKSAMMRHQIGQRDQALPYRLCFQLSTVKDKIIEV
jgi:hypothetical protein